MIRTPSAIALLLALCAPAVAQTPEDDGVFRTYRELLDLLDRRTVPVQAETEREPSYVLHGVKIVGQAGDRVVQLEATFDIEATGDWVVVPIAFGEASLESVSGAKGRARPAVGPMSVLTRNLPAKTRAKLPRTGFGMLIQGGGRAQATVRFAVPIQSKPGESQFKLTLPGASLTQLDATLPQSGIAVRVDGDLAREPSESHAGKTSVRAFFGPGALARVTWNPKPKAVAGSPTLEPLLFAETRTFLRLEEGVLQATVRVDYRIHQAPCGEFKVRFPKGFTLLSVDAPSLRSYPKPVAKGGGSELTIALRGKASGSYGFTLRLERVLGEGVTEVEFPRISTIGTERENGVLAAIASEHLSLEPAKQAGLSQVDAKGFGTLFAKVRGAVQRRKRPPLMFRYQRQPYALTLRSSPIEAEVEGRVHSLAVIKVDEVAIATAVQYTIEKRGIFGVRLRLPLGYQLLECGDPSLVKDHRIEPAGEAERKAGLGDVLAVDFVEEKRGALNLRIYGLVRRTPQPATGSAKVDLPHVHLLDVAKESGILAVGAQSQLKLELERKGGLLALGIDTLSSHGFPHGVNRGEEMIVGFRYAKPDGVRASFSVQRRAPKVTAKVETLVDAQEDRVRVHTTIKYNAQYAAVDQVRLETSGDLAARGVLKFAPGLKNVSSEVADGLAVWTLALQGGRIGPFSVSFSYDIKLDAFSAGTQRRVTLRKVRVLDCFAETGDIALKKHENVVIDEFDREGVEKRDTRDLPSGIRLPGVVSAYRYVAHPYRLTLRVTKYDFRAPLGVLVRHLHQDELVAEDGSVKVEATISLQNLSEQSLNVLLPVGAKLERIKVDGRNVKWTTKGAQEGRPSVQIHLGEVTQSKRGEPFQIRMRYDMVSKGAISGTGTMRLEPLRFPLPKDPDAKLQAARPAEIPVEQMTRALFLPGDFYYLNFDGPAATLFRMDDLWDDVKDAFGVPSGNARTHVWRGANAAVDAIATLKAMADTTADVGLYPRLELPPGGYLLESQGEAVAVEVRYMSKGLYYFFSLLILLGVVAGAFLLDGRKVLGPIGVTASFVGLSVLGAIVSGPALEPFFGCAFVGSLGVGGVFLVRGIYREMTTGMQQRQQERAERRAQVAKARAAAAEAEALQRQAAGSQS